MIRNIATLAGFEYDVVIVGGGIYGACAARDAAMRGLSVALIDRDDFGSATSHNSYKLIHGGMRYIQHVDFRRMRQSVNERRIWLATAPHLVRPLTFVNPTHGMTTRSAAAFWVAMRVHEAVGYDRNKGVLPENTIPAGRIVSKAAGKKLLPGLDDAEISGAAVWYDGQMQNANRVLLGCIASAVEHGAVVANYVEATELLERDGCIRGVRAVDKLDGQAFDIVGRHTLNTCGPWIDEIRERGPERLHSAGKMPLTVSMNLVTRRFTDDHAYGVTSRQRSDSLVDSGSRMYFATPWRDRTIIGTTHEDWSGEPDDCAATEQDIQRFLDEFNEAYPPAELGMSDVLYCHRGLTPGDEPTHQDAAGRSRKSTLVDHGREDGISGLTSVIGVKFTTARLVAEEAVDRILSHLGRSAVACETRTAPLPGAEGYPGHDALVAEIRASGSVGSLSPEVADSLSINYGTGWKQVAGDAHDDDVAPDIQYFQRVAEHAVRHEMAVRLEDVILRRGDFAEQGLLSQVHLDWCGEMMARELGWSESRKSEEFQRTKTKLRSAFCLLE